MEMASSESHGGIWAPGTDRFGVPRAYGAGIIRLNRVYAEIQTFSHSWIHLTVARGGFSGKAICG